MASRAFMQRERAIEGHEGKEKREERQERREGERSKGRGRMERGIERAIAELGQTNLS